MAIQKLHVFAGKGGMAGCVLILLLGVGLVATSGSVSADNGRDFAGTYSLSGVTQSGDNTTLTFSMQVFNYSGADVSDATITLDDPVRADQSYATFAGISIASRDNTLVSSSITVPSREYEDWQQGVPPHLIIHFTDSMGNNRQETVELAQGLVGEGQ